MTAFNVIVWACVVIFVMTGVIALLALVNRIRLGQNPIDHDRYLRTLFNVLIVGIVVAGITTFAIYLKDRISALEIVVWSCAMVFVATGLIASLAIVNKVRLGQTQKDHNYYKRKLFNLLIAQISVAGVAAFGLYLKDNPIVSKLNKEKADLIYQRQELQDKIKELTGEWEGDFSKRDYWSRGTAHWQRAQKEITDPAKYNESLGYALEEYRLALGSKLDNPYSRVHVATF